MKKRKIYLLKILATFVLVTLVVVNFKIGTDGVTTNEAFAGPTYDNMELADRECWVNGEIILMCVHGAYVCDASDQGTCSPYPE